MTIGTFRPHRGSYAESEALRFTFDSLQMLQQHLSDLFAVRPWNCTKARSSFYCRDDRMSPSESFIVLNQNGLPLGWCSVDFGELELTDAAKSIDARPA